MPNMKKQSDYCMGTYIDVQAERQRMSPRPDQDKMTIPNPLLWGTARTPVSWINQGVKFFGFLETLVYLCIGIKQSGGELVHAPKQWTGLIEPQPLRDPCFNHCADGDYHRFESCPDYKVTPTNKVVSYIKIANYKPT